MLKDLDRRGPVADVEIPLPVSQYVHQLERRPDRIWLIGLVVLALLVTAGIWMYYPVLHQHLMGMQINNSVSVASHINDDVAPVHVNNGKQSDIIDNLNAEAIQPRLPVVTDLQAQTEMMLAETTRADTQVLMPQILPAEYMDEVSYRASARDNDVMNEIMQSQLKLQYATKIATAVDAGKVEHQLPANPVHSVEEADEPRINITNRASTGEQRSRKLLAYGKQLMLAGAEQKAIRVLQDALKLDAELTEARERLITLLMQQNDADALEPWLEEGLAIDPQNEVFVTARSRQLAVQGKYQQAIELMAGAIEAGNSSENVLAVMAAIYQQTGNFSASARIYNQLLAANPGQAGWWLGFAISLENLGEVSAAIESYRRAVDTGQLQPNLIEYARQRVAALSAM